MPEQTPPSTERLIALLPEHFMLRYFGPANFAFCIDVSDILEAKDNLLPAVKKVSIDELNDWTAIENVLFLAKLSYFEPELPHVIKDPEIFREIVISARDKVNAIPIHHVLGAIVQHAQEVFIIRKSKVGRDLRLAAIQYLEKNSNRLTAEQLAKIIPHIPDEIFARYMAFKSLFKKHPNLFSQTLERMDIVQHYDFMLEILVKTAQVPKLRDSSLSAINRFIDKTAPVIETACNFSENTESQSLCLAKCYIDTLLPLLTQLNDPRKEIFRKHRATIQKNIEFWLMRSGKRIHYTLNIGGPIKQFQANIEKGSIPMACLLLVLMHTKESEYRQLTSLLNTISNHKKSIIDTFRNLLDEGFTMSQSARKTEIEQTHTQVFWQVLNEPTHFDALMRFYTDTCANIAEVTGFTPEELYTKAKILSQALEVIPNAHQEQLYDPIQSFALCYGPAMLLCGLIERLLDGANKQIRSASNSASPNETTESTSLASMLATSSKETENPLHQIFGRDQLRVYEFTLLTTGDPPKGLNLRNNLAHLNPQLVLTPLTVSHLLYLFTDLWATLVAHEQGIWTVPPPPEEV